MSLTLRISIQSQWLPKPYLSGKPTRERTHHKITGEKAWRRCGKNKGSVKGVNLYQSVATCKTGRIGCLTRSHGIRLHLKCYNSYNGITRFAESSLPRNIYFVTFVVRLFPQTAGSLLRTWMARSECTKTYDPHRRRRFDWLARTSSTSSERRVWLGGSFVGRAGWWVHLLYKSLIHGRRFNLHARIIRRLILLQYVTNLTIKRVGKVLIYV